MEITLTDVEIRAILQGCQRTLRRVRKNPNYCERSFQSSKYFPIANNIVIYDTFHGLVKFDEAVED